MTPDTSKTYELRILHAADWENIKTTRLAILCGTDEPSPEQLQIASDEADEYVANLEPEIPPEVQAALDRVAVKARERRSEHQGKRMEKYKHVKQPFKD